jgi:hypothetical protein
MTIIIRSTKIKPLIFLDRNGIKIFFDIGHITTFGATSPFWWSTPIMLERWNVSFFEKTDVKTALAAGISNYKEVGPIERQESSK